MKRMIYPLGIVVIAVQIGLVIGVLAKDFSNKNEVQIDWPTAPTYVPDKPGPYVNFGFGGGLDALFFKATPAPEEEPPAPVLSVQYYPQSTVEFDFLEGWYDGGGGAYKDGETVSRWVHCESTWQVVTSGFYLGLVQFAPSTWGSVAILTGLWDAYDPYQQGYNAAIWAQNSNPGIQWPVCWWR